MNVRQKRFVVILRVEIVSEVSHAFAIWVFMTIGANVWMSTNALLDWHLARTGFSLLRDRIRASNSRFLA